MSDQLILKLKSTKLKGEIRFSGSKSISNRLLIMAQMADAVVKFENLSNSDDTRLIQRLLMHIEDCSSSRIPMVIDAGNAGTVFRFMTAYVSIKKGKWLLTGNIRMKGRPISGLVDALINLGADIQYAGEILYPPLRIEGDKLAGGNVGVDASKSSQFVTALMLIAPYLEGGLTIKLMELPVSFAYIQMTESLMKSCGVKLKIDDSQIVIEPGEYIIGDMCIEPDWSSVSYWYEMAAIADDVDLFLPGFTKESVQGDSICADIFQKLGVNTTFGKNGIHLKTSTSFNREFEFDFTDYPDLVPAVMATCAAKQIKASFFGVDHLKYKESDRIKSLSKELLKIGAIIESTNKGVQLIPSGINASNKQLKFNTHDDHRIAMCLSPLVLKFKEVVINDPDVVTKSYPGFWEDIKKIGIADVEERQGK